MIICHCNRIGHREIARAAAELAERNPGVPVTAAAVYNALGVRPRCGCCAALLARFAHGRSEDDGCVPARSGGMRCACAGDDVRDTDRV